MSTAPVTPTAPRYVAGAGSHVKRNVPGKRIKALHRKYGAGSSLKAFARQCAKPSLGGFPGAPDGASCAAAKAWLAGKGL